MTDSKKRRTNKALEHYAAKRGEEIAHRVILDNKGQLRMALT